MKQTILRYGIIGGLIVTVLFLGPIVVMPESYLDPEKMASGEVIGYTIMILSMLCVFFGIRHLRKISADDHFSFGRGLISGIAISLVASIVFYFGNVLLYEVIAPDFLSEFGTYYKEYLLEQASTQAEKEQVRMEFEASAGMLENSYAYAAVMAATTLLIGLIVSLVSALILMRKSS